MPHIENDPIIDSKLPSDAEPVDDEGTAPPVKSGWRPSPKKMAPPKQILQTPPKEKYIDDPELGRLPVRLHNKIHTLIDHTVDKRVKSYMDNFR